MTENLIEYEIVAYEPDGTSKLKFINTKFDDIIFKLGQVSFEDVNDEALMHYHYDVLEHTQAYDQAELDQMVGNLLVQMIQEGIKDNNLVYTGGTDAD